MSKQTCYCGDELESRCYLTKDSRHSEDSPWLLVTMMQSREGLEDNVSHGSI